MTDGLRACSRIVNARPAHHVRRSINRRHHGKCTFPLDASRCLRATPCAMVTRGDIDDSTTNWVDAGSAADGV